MTRSPIELFWTAKNIIRFCCLTLFNVSRSDPRAPELGFRLRDLTKSSAGSGEQEIILAEVKGDDMQVIVGRGGGRSDQVLLALPLGLWWESLGRL